MPNYSAAHYYLKRFAYLTDVCEEFSRFSSCLSESDREVFADAFQCYLAHSEFLQCEEDAWFALAFLFFLQHCGLDEYRKPEFDVFQNGISDKLLGGASALEVSE